MFEKVINVYVIGGSVFEENMYNLLMLRFKESFSYDSLSIERAFNDLHALEKEYNMIKNRASVDYYDFSFLSEKLRIDRDLRRFIVSFGHDVGILPGDCNSLTPQSIVDKEFNENFKYMKKDMHNAIEVRNGEYSPRDTYRSVGEFFKWSFEINSAREKAFNMQKDNLDAFDYAMNLNTIGINEIIKINDIVNNSNPDKVSGFKKTNNYIRGARFDVSDKTSVPTQMAELIADYNNNFGMEILDPGDSNISSEERDARLLNIFKREALFHIRFERIHPFEDGNGRTGRIIMNKHLMDLGMAPVLITNIMSDEYKEYIATCNSDKLAKMMLASSSQTLSTWISFRDIYSLSKKSLKDNPTLAELILNNKKSKIKSLYKLK